MSTRDARGRWLPGSGSPNPRGRVSKASRPAGTDGTASYGGAYYGSAGESHSDLTGSEKWITYANAVNKGVVATGVRFFLNLLGGTKWSVVENENGGRLARMGAEIVQAGLLDAPMMKPWPQVVRKAALYRLLGYSIHACAMRRRKDGLIVFSSIEHRPQHTIEKWLRKSEFAPWDSVQQRSKQTGAMIDIPLDECLFLTDDTLSDTPDGVGILRHVIELVRRLGLYEDLEGKAHSEDLGGTPIGWAPLAEIEAANAGKTREQITAAQEAATSVIRAFLEKRQKSPEITQWQLYDSDTYVNPDGSKTGNKKWGIDILRSETANLPNANVVIARLELQIARVLGTEFTLMGGDGKGSFAMHEDKTSMFATNLQATLDEMSWAATMQLARRLVARNGLDPDLAAPKLVAEPISTEAVLTATQALANLSVAGLMPNDPAINVIRQRMRLPPVPDDVLDIMTRRPEPTPPRSAELDENDPTGADGTETVDGDDDTEGAEE